MDVHLFPSTLPAEVFLLTPSTPPFNLRLIIKMSAQDHPYDIMAPWPVNEVGDMNGFSPSHSILEVPC